MNFYDNLNAKNVFHFFEEISKIPRGPLTKKVSVIIYSYFALQKVHMNLENSILKSLEIIRDGSFWPLSYVLLYP